jgi:alkanesulfonate monooxygenase SsuD/methylene tetrahydromethanopterin reductase-like flavin-dependent oxidoreductase (luciferase family)
MLQITAEIGQGWIPWNRTEDFYAGALQEIRTQATELGRAEEITYGTAMLVVPDRLADQDFAMVHGDQPNITRTSIKPWAERYEAAGAELFAILIFPPEDALDVARHVARELI